MSLEILLLSDIGSDFHFLDKLMEVEANSTYDYVFLAGGAGTTENIIGEPLDEESE